MSNFKGGVMTTLGLVLLLLLPMTIIAGFLHGFAKGLGWSPLRAWRLVVFAWLLPVAGWLLTGWTPAESWSAAVDHLQAGTWWMVWAELAPLLLPLALSLGALQYGVEWNQVLNGQGVSPRKAGEFMRRLWSRSMRRAAGETRHRFLVPLLDRHGNPVIGRTAVHEVGTSDYGIPKDTRLLTIPHSALGQHMALLGSPGRGKTVLLMRLMRAWLEAAWLRYGKGTGDRPLLIFLNCKGGDEAGVMETNFRQMCESYGLHGARVGQWPPRKPPPGARPVEYGERLDLWSLGWSAPGVVQEQDPLLRLAEVLAQLVPENDVFFEDILDELVWLVITAGDGPPASSVEFIDRLSLDYLVEAHKNNPGAVEFLRTNKRHIPAIMARYRGFFRRVGLGFDGGRRVEDFDALILTVEGTMNRKTASAQAQGIVELITDMAAQKGFHRDVLFVIDEFSAVSSRVNISNLAERARSLGIGVLPVAQSYRAFGPDEDERHRLLETMAGGVLCMSTPNPDDVVKLAGTKVAVEVGVKRLDDGSFGDEGTGRAQYQLLASPDQIRAMGKWPGAVAYMRNNEVCWGIVAPGGLYERPGFGTRAMLKDAAYTPIEGPRLVYDELEAGRDDPALTDERSDDVADQEAVALGDELEGGAEQWDRL